MFQARKIGRLNGRCGAGRDLREIALQHLAQISGIPRRVVVSVVIEDHVHGGRLRRHFHCALFPWAFYPRSQAAALKLHTLLSLRGNLPAWAAITKATYPEMKMLDEIPIYPGAFYIMDRGYLDFTRLIRLELAGAFFVESRPVDTHCGLRCDQTIRLTTPWARRSYSAKLRRISFRDQEGRALIFLTNNFELPPELICELYKRRWQVELFFKWVKQHLRIRHFFGRSENAIRCQIWTAICAYLLVAIAKKQHHLQHSLYEMLQIISISGCEHIPLNQLFKTSALQAGAPQAQQTPLSLGF